MQLETLVASVNGFRLWGQCPPPKIKQLPLLQYEIRKEANEMCSIRGECFNSRGRGLSWLMLSMPAYLRLVDGRTLEPVMALHSDFRFIVLRR